MTSFWRLSGLDVALTAVAVVMLAAGCGPQDGSREFERGRAAFELKDYNAAAREFAKGLELAPGDLDARLQLAMSRRELGDVTGARDAVAGALALAGDDPTVLELKAEIDFLARDYDSAAKVWSTMAEDRSLAPAVRARAWTGLGILSATRSAAERTAARVALLKALKLDFRQQAAWYRLGRLYRDAFGFNAAALEHLQMFVGLGQASDPRVKDVLAVDIPALREQLAGVAAVRPGAARRDSAASSAALGRAQAALKAGKVDTAVAEYVTALKLDPLSHPAAFGLAKARLRLAPKKGAADPQSKALEAFVTACQLKPGDTETALAAGELAARLGQHATAVKIYSQALAYTRTNITVIDGLIRALRKAGRGSEAALYQGYRDFLSAKK